MLRRSLHFCIYKILSSIPEPRFQRKNVYRESRYPTENVECRKGWGKRWDADGNIEGRCQGVTQRCRLSWVTNSALSYMSPNAGGGGELRGLSQWVQLCAWSPNELWRSNSIFNLWQMQRRGEGFEDNCMQKKRKRKNWASPNRWQDMRRTEEERKKLRLDENHIN